MIRKTLLIISSALVAAIVVVSACSSQNAYARAENNQNFEDRVSTKTQKTYESLWNSDLFNESRFMIDTTLTSSQKKEAKKLARSFESHMDDSALFMHYLLTELKKRNMPIELAALPLVESGYNPRARSHAGAHGPWQFIRSTGKSLGLERTKNYDEFYDFIESTEASLTYIQHLYDECERNWDLAIASYNQGEFAVKKAIRRAKKNGVKTEDLSLKTVKLSAHANLYVTRFKAYADILKYPEKYGVKRPEIQNRPAFRKVLVAGRIDSMKQAAELSGVGINTLKHLNAGYLTDSLTSNEQRGLLVPIDNAEKLEKAIGIVNVKDKVQAY